MPQVTIKIKNLPQIRAAFSKAPFKMRKGVNEAIAKSVISVERESKQRTPVKTGYLRASHLTTLYDLKGTIEPTANYAIYVHEGTRYMRGRPFLFEGARAAEPQIDKFFTDAVQKVLDEIARESG